MDERGNGRHYHAKCVVHVLLPVKENTIFHSTFDEKYIRTNSSLFLKAIETIYKL